MQRTFSLILIALILIMVLPIPGKASAALQESATAMLQEMTPQERIGQLFILSFSGDDPNTDDLILELISDHHISGVVLRADQDNFNDSPESLTETKLLIERLQSANYEASLAPDSSESATGISTTSVYVPLFIGIAQEGGGELHNRKSAQD